MAPIKYDGVIEAVRYSSDGRLELARVYERRGATFSDVTLLTRPELVSRLRSRKKYFTGTRKTAMGGTFDTSAMVHLVKSPGGEWVLICAEEGDSDNLEPAPIF